MEKGWSKHQRHWARHFTSVPKGFCRLFVLKLLGEKAMSGAELMNAIEERTNGQWRPSPGSIYPLLKWLADKELIEMESIRAGEKKYLLTDKGADFLEDASRFKQDILAKLHGQQSIIHEMFHDTERDEVDNLLEEIHLTANSKKEVSKEQVIAILSEAKHRLKECTK